MKTERKTGKYVIFINAIDELHFPAPCKSNITVRIHWNHLLKVKNIWFYQQTVWSCNEDGSKIRSAGSRFYTKVPVINC